MQSPARRSGLGYSDLTSKWGSFVALGVLLITYVPWLTLGLLHLLGRGQ